MVISGHIVRSAVVTLLVAAFTAVAPNVVAQPETETTLSDVLARIQARGDSSPALAAAMAWVASNGDLALPLNAVSRSIRGTGAGWGMRDCSEPVIAFEVNADPFGNDVAAMIYPSYTTYAWEEQDSPGVLSPVSGVRFIFVNIDQQFVAEIPWDWTGTRTIPSYFDRAVHFNHPIRFSQLAEFGGGTVVGLFIGPDMPTNGPGCAYGDAVVANGDYSGCWSSWQGWLCPSGYPYNRYEPPYG
ncbi:hypothetical protein [Nocardia anaemiae]|uniref:hypothetical protein n=1 Tax=Nocardia anaemiae TaxID=263910 RepID=UPI000AC3B41F|nr:hypothetical protein [Nocardia anaemiae]